MKAKIAETTVRRTEITIETSSVTRIRRAFTAQSATEPQSVDSRRQTDAFRSAEAETTEEEQ